MLFRSDLIVRSKPFRIKEGQVLLNFFSWGRNLEGMETLKWAYYIHETLHDFNIIGHAPGNGWPLGIMTNQSGISYALNPWEQFLFDWLPASQIYCDDIKTLKTATISLTPVEREDQQTKMAVIKLSETSTRATLICVTLPEIVKLSACISLTCSFCPIVTFPPIIKLAFTETSLLLKIGRAHV